MSTTAVPTGARWTGMSSALPSVSSWSAAAGPIRVGGDEQRPAALLDEVPGELRRRGRLARALEADEGDHGRVALEVERPIAGCQQRDELVVDDLHDLLAGRQALEDLGSDRLLADAGDEVLDDLEVDVRLEEAEPDLAHRGVDVRFADAAAAGQVGKGLAKALAQAVEHGWVRLRRGSQAGRFAPRARGGRVVREFWRTEAWAV